jgi:hypothetical protein
MAVLDYLINLNLILMVVFPAQIKKRAAFDNGSLLTGLKLTKTLSFSMVFWVLVI